MYSQIIPNDTPAKALNVGKIPSLDGLRAISMVLVMLSHCAGTSNFPASASKWVFPLGHLGVQVFFVISGYLITSLLIKERRSTATISLKGFYIRRGLRIFPAFYAYISIIGVLFFLGSVKLPPNNLLYAATYTMNYVKHGTWLTGHLWSLSVEEQFYLLWPVSVLLFGNKMALRGAAFVAILSPLLLAGFYWSRSTVNISLWFPIVGDSIATGCLLGGFLPSLLRIRRTAELLGRRAGGAIPIMILMVAELASGHPRASYPLAEWFLNGAIAYVIARYATFPEGLGGKVLNAKPMVFIGMLSYSLYLWQQPFLNEYARDLWTTFPLNIACAFACAVVSYFLLERPLIGLRRRLRT